MIGFNEINANDAWIEMKKVFWTSFIPDDYAKYKQTVEWCLEIENTQRKHLEEFTSIVIKEEKNFNQEQLYNKYKQVLEDYEVAKHNTKDVAISYEGLVNSRPLLSSYSNILIIVYISYKQYANIMGRDVYSWKAYLTIIRLIIKKLLRDVGGR